MAACRSQCNGKPEQRRGSWIFRNALTLIPPAGGNNGSAFAGFNANTPFWNVSIGLVMLFARFLPITGILAIAGKYDTEEKTGYHSRHPFHQ